MLYQPKASRAGSFVHPTVHAGVGADGAGPDARRLRYTLKMTVVFAVAASAMKAALAASQGSVVRFICDGRWVRE